MGKKKVPIVLIEDVIKRRSTLNKRLTGLMKKAHDLSILCNAKIAVVVIDEQEEIHPYTNNNSVEEIWEPYSANSPRKKRERLECCKEKLRSETEKAEIACQAKKACQAKNDTNQKDSSEPIVEHQEHHDTLQNTELPSNFHWNNNCMPQQHTSCGSSSFSIEEVGEYYNTSSTQHSPQSGSNMQFNEHSSIMIDANGNKLDNWSNTNGTNCENIQQPKQEHQIPCHVNNIPMPNANGNNWLPNIDTTNFENNQPNQEYDNSIYENNIPMQNANGNNWLPNTDATNFENNQPNQEYDNSIYENNIPMQNANGNNWLPNTDATNFESNQPNQEYDNSIYENNVEAAKLLSFEPCNPDMIDASLPERLL